MKFEIQNFISKIFKRFKIDKEVVLFEFVRFEICSISVDTKSSFDKRTQQNNNAAILSPRSQFNFNG